MQMTFNGSLLTRWDSCTGVISCGILPADRMISRVPEINVMVTGSPAFPLLIIHYLVISQKFQTASRIIKQPINYSLYHFYLGSLGAYIILSGTEKTGSLRS